MLRDNYIVAIQELKDAHVPFYSRIIEDNEGAQSVAISDKIFGNVRYIESGKWGMGDSNIITSRQNGTIYFVDTNNSLPIRDGYDGVGSIAGKLEKFFKRVIQLAKRQGKQITLTYDNYNDELLLSIETDGDIVKIASFTASEFQEGEYYTVVSASLAITDAPDKATLGSIVSGLVLYTPTPGETGADSITFTFTNSLGNLITKSVCLTILDASTDVADFFFVDVVNAEFNIPYTSNPILVSGNPSPAPVSIVNGTYSINGGAFTSALGLAYDGDQITVKRNSSPTALTSVNTTLTVGNKSDIYDILTQAEDTVPEAFLFVDTDEANLGGLSYDSNEIEVEGINVSVPVTITGGTYSKNGGAFTAADGTAVLGDTFIVRVLSSEDYETAESATLTIGGVSDTFTVTTRANDPIACGASSSFTGGPSFPTEETIILGTDLGDVTLTYNTFGIPDKFEVWFDGVKVIDTGYRGSAALQGDLDTELISRSLPTELIAGIATGSAMFTKSTATTTALVKVYAPLPGTGWSYGLSCPV